MIHSDVQEITGLRLIARKIRRSMVREGFVGTIGLSVRNLVDLLRRRKPSPQTAHTPVSDFDRLHGVRTSGIVELSALTIDAHNDVFGVRYQATPESLFREMLAHVPLKPWSFVFIDFGSGKGRTLLMASEWPFRKIIGVEFARELHRIALENIDNYRGDTQQCRDVSSVCMDAGDYRLPADPAVLYFYHPFGAQVMAAVFARLKASLESSPRKLYVVYYNPVCGEMFRSSPLFRVLYSNSEYAIYETV
jgi:hypothetical protein